MAKRSAKYIILISLFFILLSVNSALYGQSNLSKLIKDQTDSNDKIKATFSYSPIVPVTGIPVRFVCKTNHTPESWLWEFGDGNISYEPSPSHEYDKAGFYNVTLTVALNGSSARATKKVRVYASKTSSTETKTQELVPSFEFTPATPEAGLIVQFTDQSTGNPTSWSWDFGDGGKSTVQNPQHQFNNSGTFNVTLTISNGTSSKSLTRSITVIAALIPGFNFTPSNPESGEVIQFQDKTSGNPTAWNWNFGDGSTSNLQNPTHSYNTAGTYNVTFQVSNGYYTKTMSRNITVSAPIAVDFSYNPAAPVAGQDVQFVNSSTGSITSYSWDFGDGSTSSLKDPVHKYSSAGSYTITLTASNARSSKTQSKTITVNQSLTPSFTYTPSSPYAGQSVQFTDGSSGNPSSWQWNFGDGGTSNLKNPTHIYSSAGNYTVTLTVANNVESKSTSKTITVKPLVQADFTYSPSNPTVGASIQFTDKSTGNITSWSWQFGDGSTSTQKNPTKAYTAAGSYNVKLTVSDGTTSNSMTQTITVAAALVADFSYSPSAPVVGQEVQFLDNSQGSPTSWSWDFGDGGQSSSRNPKHVFSQKGTFNVTLVVKNETGSATKTKQLIISGASESLLVDRIIDWGIAGVWVNGVKGIPERSTIFCNVKVNIPGSSLIAYGDGVHDDTAALQAAINLCPAGQVVYLPAGTYLVSSSLTINKGITFRGEVDAENNPLTEIVQKTTLDSNSGTIIITGTSGYPYTTVTDVTGGYQKGSTTITVSNASAFKVNDIVTLDELNNPELVTNYGRIGDDGTLNQCTYAGRISGGARAYGETFLVKAISGNTITLNRPLYWDFQGNLNPQLYLHSKVPLYYAGVENIHLRTVSTVSDGSGIILQHCAYCWVKNCEIESFPRRALWLRYGTYGCEIRHNYIHNKSSDSNFERNRRYGIFIYSNCSDNLIEDNIVHYTLSGLVMEAGNSGNVISYNYIDTTRYGSQPWKTPDMALHAPHNYMNLFEGNVMGQIEFDIYWGSSSHQMVFRNWLHTRNPDWYVNQPRLAISCEGWNRCSSFIGNVLGYPNIVEAESPWPVYYEQLPLISTFEQVHMWRVGFWSGADGTPQEHGDPMTLATIIRHGNYDFVRNRVEWDTSISDYILAPSFYLKSKPDWFGSLSWPAIGPDLSPVNGKIPAQWRFENKKYFVYTK